MNYKELSTPELEAMHSKIAKQWRKARDKKKELEPQLDAMHAELYRREME